MSDTDCRPRSELPISFGFVRITGEQRDLVALGVAEVADGEMGPVGVAEARLALVSVTSGARRGVKVTDLLLALHAECDHRTVPCR